MTNCKFIITDHAGKLLASIPIETSDLLAPSVENLVKAIKLLPTNNRADIYDALKLVGTQEKYKDTININIDAIKGDIKSNGVDESTNNMGLVSNMTYALALELFDNYSKDSHGEPIILKDVNLIYTSDLSINNKSVNNKLITDANGSKFYVVCSNRKSILTFNKFLKLEQSIANFTYEQAVAVFGKDIVNLVATNTGELRKVLEQLLNNDNIDSDYNTTGYDKKRIIYDLYLLAVFNTIKVYKDPFTEAILNTLMHLKKGSPKEISLRNLLELYKNTHPGEEVPETVKELESKISSDELIFPYLKYEGDEDKGTFSFSPIRKSIKQLVELNNLSEIVDAPRVDQYSLCHRINEINGYNIYKVNVNNQEYYFKSPNIVTLLGRPNLYRDKKAVETELTAYADHKPLLEYVKIYKLFTLTLINNRATGIRQFKVLPGLIYEVLDSDTERHKDFANVNIPEFKLTLNLYKQLLRNTFENEYNTNSILKDFIDNMTPGLAYHSILYFYDDKSATLASIRDKVNNLKKVQYQVLDCVLINKTSVDKESAIFDVYASRVEFDNKISPAQEVKSLPIYKIYDTIIKQLESTSGGLISEDSIQILNAEDLKDLLTREKLPAEVLTSKSFIHNNIIYLNAPIATPLDFLHEYTHLLLGVIKLSKLDDYMSLLSDYEKSLKSSGKMRNLDKISAYEGLSYTDKLEESFANDYAQFLLLRERDNFFKNASDNITSTMSRANTIIKSMLGNITNMGNIEDICKDIDFFSKKDAEDKPSSDKLKEMLDNLTKERLITNFIKKNILLKDKNKNYIEENCQ